MSAALLDKLGTHLYNFSVQIQGKDMQFGEETGTQLFWDRFKESGIPVDFSNKIIEGFWTVRYMKNWDSKGDLAVIALNLTLVDIAKTLQQLAITKLNRNRTYICALLKLQPNRDCRLRAILLWVLVR